MGRFEGEEPEVTHIDGLEPETYRAVSDSITPLGVWMFAFAASVVGFIFGYAAACL